MAWCCHAKKAIALANVNLDVWRHIASLGNKELNI